MARLKNDGKGRMGGRQKGTPNKSRLPLIEKAEELNVDPFEILLLFSKGDWEALGYKSGTRQIVTGKGSVIEVDTIEPSLRVVAAKEACQYLHPKRKAIELSGKDGGPLDFYLSMSPEERQRRKRELESRLNK